MPPQVHQPAKSLHTLADLARALHRSAVYLHGIQARFELPAFDGDGYSTAYLELLRTLVYLRTLAVSEETLRDLWQIEKKLLQLLHADSTGSPTWFLDSCGATTHPERRLLLTNYDLGVPFTGGEVQTGLNFADSLPNCSPARKWARTLCVYCANASNTVPASSPTSPPNSRSSAPPPNGV